MIRMEKTTGLVISGGGVGCMADIGNLSNANSTIIVSIIRNTKAISKVIFAEIKLD
jgi:hypothetical protein